MEPRKIRFWVVVLAGVMILSSGLPLSARHSAAQPSPPEAIKGVVPLSHALEANDQHLNEVLEQRNQELEKLKGRKLEKSERVKLARRVVLQPHSDSPVKDVIVIAYELSDGTVGHTLVSPFIANEAKGPFGYHIDDMNMEEGWYIVRFLTPEELQSEPKAQTNTAPSPAEEGKPLSFLERMLRLFSPSEAVACSGGCQPLLSIFTHSASQPELDGTTRVAVDGVKMQYQQRDGQTCSPKILNTWPRCEAFGGWGFFSPCPQPTPQQLSGAVQAFHGDTYVFTGPNGTTTVSLSSHIWANEFFFTGDGSCGTPVSSDPQLAVRLNCGTVVLDEF